MLVKRNTPKDKQRLRASVQSSIGFGGSAEGAADHCPRWDAAGRARTVRCSRPRPDGAGSALASNPHRLSTSVSAGAISASPEAGAAGSQSGRREQYGGAGGSEALVDVGSGRPDELVCRSAVPRTSAAGAPRGPCLCSWPPPAVGIVVLPAGPDRE